MTKKKNLVIVESPTKAKTISKYLGKGYTVKATVGHIRDLPKRELGVDIDAGFVPKYVTIRGKGKMLTELRNAAKSSAESYRAPGSFSMAFSATASSSAGASGRTSIGLPYTATAGPPRPPAAKAGGHQSPRPCPPDPVAQPPRQRPLDLIELPLHAPPEPVGLGGLGA